MPLLLEFPFPEVEMLSPIVTTGCEKEKDKKVIKEGQGERDRQTDRERDRQTAKERDRERKHQKSEQGESFTGGIEYKF